MYNWRKRTLKDFFYGYLVISSSYASINFTKLLIKQYKKYSIAKNLFNQIGLNNTINIDNFYLLSGKVKKLISPIKNSFNENLIGVKGNSTYFENFILICEKIKYIILPTPLTKFYSLTKSYITNEKNNLPEANKLFISKSEILSNGDNIYLFGKIISNQGNIIENYENFKHIKPYMISHSSFDDLKKNSLSFYPILKSILQISFCGLLFMIGIKHFYLKYQYWNNINKKRFSVKCTNCKNNLCDILCEKCENLTNYCSKCYLELQNKINSKKIKLKNIRCVHCNKTLDVVQLIKYK